MGSIRPKDNFFCETLKLVYARIHIYAPSISLIMEFASLSSSVFCGFLFSRPAIFLTYQPISYHCPPHCSVR